MRPRLGLVAIVGALAVFAGIVVATLANGAPRDEGWVIERFDARIAVQPDGSLRISEAIDVDFGALERRGIFRDVPVRYRYTATQARVYALAVEGVTDAAGRRIRFDVFDEGAFRRIRIGDPNARLSGPQTYRVAYRVAGALNAFEGHDELFWNVNGADWPVPTRAVSATVTAQRGAVDRAACFEGRAGSRDACRITSTTDAVTFAATRRFARGEQLTIVAALRKGAVAVPPPVLEPREREFVDLFELNGATLSLAGLLLLGGLVAVGGNLYYAGRDRRYLRMYYLHQDPREEIEPLFARDPIVVEYEPPEKLRPAQVGLLLDESADPKDLTATIVDLAVRGYLAIEEIPVANVLGIQVRDWRLVKKRADTRELAPYEQELFTGLFAGRESVRLSELRGEFHPHLTRAQRQLYEEAVRRRWFEGDPSKVRRGWVGWGALLVFGGVVAGIVLGLVAGVGVVGVALALVGLLMLVLSRYMPRRTAMGRELMRRMLGFRRYMETAETDRARFAEQEHLFTAYLPYAIVFGSVTKWARAFTGLDAAKAAASWYAGTSVFDAGSFSRDLEGFSSTLSSATASTPGGSGGSGFSGGGGAGGGGGGGGGGSW